MQPLVVLSEALPLKVLPPGVNADLTHVFTRLLAVVVFHGITVETFFGGGVRQKFSKIAGRKPFLFPFYFHLFPLRRFARRARYYLLFSPFTTERLAHYAM